MPQLPAPENNYQISDPFIRADMAFWNVFAGSVGARLGALEAQRIEYAEVIVDLRTQGQLRIDAAITPLIAATQETISDLGQSIEAQEGRLVELGEQMEEILGGGIPAGNVTESATRVFVTPQQRNLFQPATVEAAGVMSAADKVELAAATSALAVLGAGLTSAQSKVADLEKRLRLSSMGF